MKAIAVIHAGSSPALLPHLVEAGQQAAFFPEPVDYALEFLSEGIGKQTGLVCEPRGPEFCSAAAKVASEVTNAAPLKVGFLVFRKEPACLVCLDGFPLQFRFCYRLRAFSCERSASKFRRAKRVAPPVFIIGCRLFYGDPERWARGRIIARPAAGVPPACPC